MRYLYFNLLKECNSFSYNFYREINGTLTRKYHIPKIKYDVMFLEHFSVK